MIEKMTLETRKSVLDFNISVNMGNFHFLIHSPKVYCHSSQTDANNETINNIYNMAI